MRADSHKRYDAMARFNPEKASVVAAHIRNIDALSAQVQQQYAVVQASANGTAPPPAAPVPAVVPVVSSVPAAAAYAPAAPASGARAPAANGGAAATPAPAAAAPAPRPAAPARTWGKMEVVTPVSLGDSSLPTPAEAFKGGPSTSAAATDADGFKAAAAKKNNRRKA